MDELTDNLRDIIRALAATGDLPYSVPGVVTAVNKRKGTVSVDPVDDSAELVGVLLQADAASGFVVYPVVGSTVIVSFLDKDNAFVSMLSQVDTYELRNQAGESLKDLLVDTLQELLNFKVLTNTGASLGVVNTPQLLAIQNRIKLFFNK
jgi:hypothetical protein